MWPVGQAVKTPPSHGGNRGSIPLRATHCYFERDKQPNPEVVSMSDGILAIFLLSKTGIFYKYDMLQWNARLGEDIFCIVEPNPFLAQMMMFLYGIVGVMLVCDIVLCVSDYHKAGMQEIIKDLPVLVMTLALILFLCWVRKSTLTEVAAGAHKIGTKTGTLGRCRIFTWDEVVSKKEFFERVTFYGKKGKKLFAVSKQYAGYESFLQMYLDHVMIKRNQTAVKSGERR